MIVGTPHSFLKKIVGQEEACFYVEGSKRVIDFFQISVNIFIHCVDLPVRF